MKKHTEKPPIDDLFARKLGGASLRPSADGFERLQARLKPNQPEQRIVFWQNPAVQRYTALAACLLLVVGFGWRYWPSGNVNGSEETQIADSRFTSPKPQEAPEPVAAVESSGAEKPELPRAVAPVDAPTASALRSAEPDESLATRTERSVGNVKKGQSTPSDPLPDGAVAKAEQPQLAQSAPSANESIPNAANRPIEPSTIAVNAPTERVLVVTIAEPEALMAARLAAQANVEEKTVAATANKTPHETKVNSLWQQVKRVKQGDVFARRPDSDEESSLLSRAYSGLKHSLDKDKSAKQ